MQKKFKSHFFTTLNILTKIKGNFSIKVKDMFIKISKDFIGKRGREAAELKNFRGVLLRKRLLYKKETIKFL